MEAAAPNFQNRSNSTQKLDLGLLQKLHREIHAEPVFRELDRMIQNAYAFMRPGRDVLIGHPDAIRILARFAGLRDEVPEIESVEQLLGVAVRTDKNLPITKRVWVFPKDPYFKYEKSDETWCRYFGIGHEEEQLNYFLVSRAAFEGAEFSFDVELPR